MNNTGSTSDCGSTPKFNVIRLNGITVEFQGRAELVAFGEKAILRFSEPESINVSFIDRRIETLRKMYVEDRKRCDMESAATRREAALWLQFARSESLGLDPYASENKLRDWDNK
jgi:hypothetical protein